MEHAAWPIWVEQLNTGVAVLDSRLRLRWLNSAFAELVGVGLRNALGLRLSRVLRDAVLIVHLRKAQRQRRPLQLRGLVLSANGAREQGVDLVAQSLPDGGLCLEMHALIEAEAAAPSLSASLRGFAHEVRNPLAGLRGAAQLLKRRVQGEELRELAELMLGEADRLSVLTDRLLQDEAHGARLSAVNVHQVLERLERLLVAQTGPALAIHHDYDPSLPEVAADGDRLLQVLLNLARNAIQAGAQQLILRTRIEHGVRLAEHAPRSALRVDVADNGKGVPPAMREILFQPWVSGHAAGSGLGLALCREIAREHGGELRYRSRPGATVFSLYLPWPGRAASVPRP